MSNFPSSFDDDTTLPVVNDNVQEIGGEAINALRDAVFNIEQEIGLGASGTTGSIAARIGVSLDPDGALKSSAIASLGLVTLPINNDQISETAEIPESKLKLDHRTQDLFNYIQDLSGDINTSLGWIASTGIKLEPHLFGAIYKHSLSQIDVSGDPSQYLKNKFNLLRDNSNSYTLIKDINTDLLAHQSADGSVINNIQTITTNDGGSYPSNYAHTASGIYLNTDRFSTIPQTAQDLQQFAEFIDSSSIFLLGTRIQNLYSNGISRTSRSSSLLIDGYGQQIIGTTPAIAYLLNTGNNSMPFDDIDYGDDIIEFKPTSAEMSSHTFDEKFALVKVGDILRINYGSVEVQFIIKEKKYIQNGGNKKYVVRINGKNLFYTSNALARIDRPLFNNRKYGVLAIASANNTFAEIPSLIVGSPRGAQALGIGFNPAQFDDSHYLLYLALYPTGVPTDGYTILPPVDVTGNRGITPGLYTLDSIVEATNNAFRQIGFNYRFIAFAHQGEFGIMLADSYRNASFSILNAIVGSDGSYDQSSTNVVFQNNVVGVFADTGNPPDPLGFGVAGANIASPPLPTSYGSAEASQIPTRIFVPLKRNNYYVNGVEREKLTLEPGQVLDQYGDGYWTGTIISRTIFPGPTGRVQTTYRIPLDLATSNIKPGKTIVVQSLQQGNLVDFGRFIIQSINVGCSPTDFTDISVYDAVHATGVSPYPTLDVNSTVAIYFNDDSVSFNKETATDFTNISAFKRHFEVFVDQVGHTFTHERARINITGSNITVNGTVTLRTFSELSKLDIVKVSSKLRGYQYGSVTKINLNIIDYNNVTGNFVGYLSNYDGFSFSHKGPLTIGKQGEVIRFYDETNIDYIDVIFNVNTSISSFSNQSIDFQLFPTLSLDEEIMLIGTCQLNDVTKVVNYVRDERQFGNISEKDLSTSALNFIAYPEKVLHGNGVIKGFNLEENGTNPNNSQIYLTGGTALVNGVFTQFNNETIVIPTIKELLVTMYDVNWVICVNEKSEYQILPLLDYDVTLNTPNSPDRVFQAFNLVNGNSYFLDGITFSNLINTRKDLTPLYIVASTTIAGVGDTPPSISLVITDVRKYVTDIDNNLPLKLTVANSQGNFKSPIAILNWIKYNNSFNGVAIVKGADADTGVINTALTLDFDSIVTIDGENNALLTMSNNVTLGSNLTLKNVSIIFNSGVSIAANTNNLSLHNCNITINVPLTAPADNVVLDFVNSTNIEIKDCNIAIQYSSAYDGYSTFRGSAFRLINVNNFKYDGNTTSVNYNISAGVITPGNVFTVINGNKLKITNSDFSGNFNKFLDNSSSNNLLLSRLTISSSYNPNAGSNPDSYGGVAYDTTNSVNSGQGYIYSNVQGTLSNMMIDQVTFNYNPLVNTSDRYSFINFELSTNTSILNNLTITNCRFNNNNVSGTKEDLRAAISIINTAPANTSTGQQPLLVNANIAHNICNRNQSIIVTSVLTNNNKMVYPGLAAQNCAIRDNVCGSIGYWISSGSKVVSITPNVNILTDKNTSLTIDSNLCHYIGTLTHKGKYFLVSNLVSNVSTNFCDYPSGYVTITNNKCNWIHTAISYEDSSSLIISKNSLCAYDMAYLNSIGDSLPTAILNTTYPSVGFSSGFAIFVSANQSNLSPAQLPSDGSGSPCIITDNVTGVGYWLQVGENTTTYKYIFGNIYCQSSCMISRNVLRGIGGTDIIAAGTSVPIAVAGMHSTVTQNHIYRSNETVYAYVAFFNLEGVSPLSVTDTTGIVVDNFFDSPTTRNTGSGSGIEEVVKIISNNSNSPRWIVERNKNQTGYISIPVTNSQMFLYGSGGVEDFDSLDYYISQAPSVGSGTGYKSLVLRIHDGESPVRFRWIGWQENLDKYMPIGSRVIQLKMGIKPFSSVVETPTNPEGGFDSRIDLFLNKYYPPADYTDLNYFGATPAVLPDTRIINDATAPTDTITGGQINSTSNTLFLDIDVTTAGSGGSDISDSFIAGRGGSFSASLDIRFRRQNTCDFYISPLMVKYRW